MPRLQNVPYGLPALMGIAGQGAVTAWYLGQMVRAGGWRVGI